MISKIRHGSDIESSKLNEIIDAINKYEAAGNSLNELMELYQTSLSEFNAVRDRYKAQLGEMLSDLPGLRELVASFAAINEYGIEWVDNTKGEVEDLAEVGKLLEDKNIFSIEKKKRIRFVIGHYTQLMPLGDPGVTEWRSPQVLFDVDNGAIYVDAVRNVRDPETNREHAQKDRILFSFGSSDADKITNLIENIVLNTPTISIEDSGRVDSEGNRQYFWKVGETIYDGRMELVGHGPLVPVYKQGPAGKDGAIGPQGKEGKQGIPGLTGQPGRDGEPGANTLIDIYYSDYASGVDYSMIYKGQKYVGFKAYLSNASASEIAATKINWMRLTGDSYIPYLDGKKIKWKAASATEVSDLEIDLSAITIKGDPGAKGDTPRIRFLKEDGHEYINGSQDFVNGNLYSTFNIEDFRGPEGKQGIPGADGPIGPTGKTGPAPRFRSVTVDYVENTLPHAEANQTETDGEYDLNFKLPSHLGIKRLAKLDDSDNLQDTYQFIYEDENKQETNGETFTVKHGIGVSNAYIDKASNTLYLSLTDGTRLKLFNMDDVKGDKGEPALMEIQGGTTEGEMLAINEEINHNPQHYLAGKTGYAYIVNYEENNEHYYKLWMWSDERVEYVNTNTSLAGTEGPAGRDGARGSQWYIGTEQPGTYYANGNAFRILLFDNAAFNNFVPQEGDLYVCRSETSYEVYKFTGFVYDTNHDGLDDAYGVKNTNLDLGYEINHVNLTMVPHNIPADATITASEEDFRDRTLNLYIPSGPSGYSVKGLTQTVDNELGNTKIRFKLNDLAETELEEITIPHGATPTPAMCSQGYLAWTINGEFINDEAGNPIRIAGIDGEKGDTGAKGSELSGVSYSLYGANDDYDLLNLGPDNIVYNGNDYFNKNNNNNINFISGIDWHSAADKLSKYKATVSNIIYEYTDNKQLELRFVSFNGKEGAKGPAGQRGLGVYTAATDIDGATDSSFITGDKVIATDNMHLYEITMNGDTVKTTDKGSLKGEKGDGVYVFKSLLLNDNTNVSLESAYGERKTLCAATGTTMSGKTANVEPGSLLFNENLKRLYICLSIDDYNNSAWLCILAPMSDYISYDNDGILNITTE